MIRSSHSKLFLAILALSAANMASATTFSNAADGSTIQSFGSPDTTSYGEVFTTTGGLLTDWTFWANSGTAGNLKLVVANWDGAKAETGPCILMLVGEGPMVSGRYAAKDPSKPEEGQDFVPKQ